MMFFKNFLLLLAAAHDSSANKELLQELSQAATEDLSEDARSFRGAAAGGPKGTSPVAGSSFFLPKPSVASFPGSLRSPRRLQPLLEPEEIFSGPNGENGFGESVAVSASAIVVGHYKYDKFKGRAYIITPDENGSYNGATQTTLEAQGVGRFGRAMAASENAVVIGAPYAIQGAVYQFHINGFLSEAFTAHSLKSGDLFGQSVAAWNDEFVIGAPHDDSKGTHSGAVYLSSGQKLIADDGSERDLFGSSVALSDGILVVGAPGDDDIGNGSGAAYVFVIDDDGTGYGPTMKLTGEEDGGQFGKSVAMSEERVCIGAPYADKNNAGNAGAVYCYDLGEEFELEKKLQGESEDNESFGFSLALSGTTLVVGAYKDGGERGAIYVYNDGYDNPTKISPPDDVEGVAVFEFGLAVAIAVNKVVVGSTSEHVFVYDITALT